MATCIRLLMGQTVLRYWGKSLEKIETLGGGVGGEFHFLCPDIDVVVNPLK